MKNGVLPKTHLSVEDRKAVDILLKWIRLSLHILILLCILTLPPTVVAAPPTDETPFEPCLQDCLAPESAPIKEMGAFQTSLFTGSASYSYPIDVPPGTNGLAPSIALSYNSHSAKDRTSWVGAGWNLNLNYIKRDVNSTPDDLNDDFFNLVLNGQQHELVYNATEGRYHTEEESYLFIENKTGSTDNQKGEYWIVKSTDGTQYRFGYTDNSEAVCTNRDYVWQWSLDEVKDTHDNYIYYSYNESPTPNDLGAVYLAKIEYNNDKKRSIEFILEDTDRQDAITIYDQGCKVRYARRLKEIQVHADTEPVAKYVLSYDVNDVSTLSLLTQIQKIGSDGITALPPTTFEYEEIGVGWVRDDSWTAPTYLGGAHGFVVADVNGDGLTDILRGYMYYDTTEPYPYEYFVNASYINTGNGWVRDDSWAPPVPFVYDKRDDGRFGDRAQVMDVNGDGLPDLIWCDYAYINTGSGWEQDNSWSTPFVYQGKKGYRTVDVNSDGLPDVLQGYMYYENHHEYFVNHAWINTGSGWVGDGSWAPPVPFVYDKRDDGRFWDRYQIADINGDGLPDLFKSDESGAYINTGSGWEFDNWGTLPAFSGQNGYRIADVNGDGLPDVVRAEMVYEDHNEEFHSAAWINTGHGWASNANWAPPFPFVYNHEDRRSWTRAIPMDADGDGLVDIIHKFNAYIHAGESYAYRLKKIQNGIGGTLSIDYESTTTCPDTELGFVMQCAKNITKDNGMSGLHYINTTNTFDYEGGRFDYSEQEFRGFSHVTVTDPLNNTHEHYFHQDDALKGKEFKTEIKDGSGNPYIKTENTWSYHESEGVYVTHLDERLDCTYDGEVSSPKITRTNYEFDDYGNIIRTATLGDVATTGDEKFVYSEYVYNTSAWIMTLVNHTYILASDDATKVKESWYYYDGDPNPPTRGDLIMGISWLDGGDDSTTYYGYDSYGNVISKTDSKGNAVNYVYGLTHTFPEHVINALGHTTSYLYDLGTGNLLRVTDSNGFVTTYEYDVFGRLIKAIKPYDGTDFPTVTYIYELDGVAPESSHSSMREKGGQTGTIDTHTFVDGFGQQIQTRYEAEDSSKEIVTNTFYDELGREEKEALPYFEPYSASYTTPLPSVKGTSYEYDPVGRNTEIENPDGTTSTIEYDHWVRTSTDENGNHILSCTDAYERIETVEEKNDGEIYTTVYDYNARDELINIMDHAGNEFIYEYDTQGRKIGQHDPDMGNWTYSYDPNGNLISQTDARGITISFQYDELDRILKQDYPNDLDIVYVYDLETDGTLSVVSDSLGTTHYYYDARLRTIEEDRIMDGRTWITNWTYDSADRITSVTYPTGEMVLYNYNNQGLLESVSSIVDNIDYNELGRILRKVYGNTVSTDLEYNEITQRLKRIYTPGLQNFSYQYDNVGNIVTIEDEIEGKIQNFGYDDLNRLTCAEESGGYGLRTYSYDPIGNFIGLDAPDLDLIFTYGEGTAGPHAVTTRLTHAYNLFISTYSPLTNPTTINGTPQTFNVTTNQICNITWLINCSIVQTNLSTTVASYTNDSAVLGIYNVTAIAENVNGSDSHSWVWNVGPLTLPVHNRNTSENFEGIQAAIDANNTTEGHIIEVDSGTYNENVNIYKSLTIRSSSGNPVDTIVQANDSNDHVFEVSRDKVTIEGFTVTGASGNAGIYLTWPANYCKILNNVVLDNYIGIYLFQSYHSAVTNNNVNNNVRYGIYLYASYYNNLTGNTVNSNNEEGFILLSSDSNEIIGNTANSNMYGIILMSSDYNKLTGNTANDNNRGIFLQSYCNNNEITGNIANDNDMCGIDVSRCNDNEITGNIVSNNDWRGIHLRDSSSNNRIYNNYFDNMDNACDDGNNIWNITKTEGTNIIGGSWQGGNYWSDYNGNDTTGDGLGDTLVPYNSSGKIQNGGDWLPLVPASVGLPVHNLNTSESFSTIQAAIDAVNTTDGHIIEVDSGTYTGNVKVNKSLTIRSTSGNPTDTIVQAANLDDHVFEVTADYVNITGFTVTGVTGTHGAGIFLYEVDNCIISDNAANNNGLGNGIRLSSSNNNIVTNNTANDNINTGIYVYHYSNNNIITNNIANGNTGSCGILVDYYSDNNTITDNTVNDNMCGIFLNRYSNHNNITGNIVTNNGGGAWWFAGGIRCESSNYNTLYNNYFNNTNNSYDDGNNQWNITKTAGTNIIGGLYLGGNYWSDYIGEDTDGDGIGDTLHPYNASGEIQNGGDWLPLVPASVGLPVHNLDSTESFSTIQAAIDAVNTTDGHIIEVDPGTYNENVNVYKSLTIRSSSGNPADTVVQAASSNDHVFEVTTEGVTITGFTVKRAITIYIASGIYLNGVNHCNVSYNRVLNNNYYGIHLINSVDNHIEGNTANNNSGAGICLESSSNNMIAGNIAYDNEGGGIGLYPSSNDNVIIGNTAYDNGVGIDLQSSCNNNVIRGNTANDNEYLGIRLVFSCNNNIITGNTANNNDYNCGIFISKDCCNNKVTENNASNNKYGIALKTDSANNNTITNNTANSNSYYGIYLKWTNNNTITNNTANSNSYYGIYSNGSSNNLIYNNYFNNTNNTYDDGTNTWNITKTAGTNIVGGPYLGGNYWSDYIGDDTDRDGIGNTHLPYNTGITNGGDWLPLTPTNVSVETSTGTGTATFSTDSGLFADINDVAENSLPQEAKANKPEGLTLPHGLFNFTITDLTPGQSVTLTITLPSSVPVGWEWWKVNTTAGNNTWYSVPIGDDDGDNVVTITLTDGGLGDIDGAANGAIIDPSGIGILSALKPGIISYAPISPVNDSVCTWRTFNVTVNQTVNVSWYLNESFLFKNESVTDARYTLHAGVIGEHNVTAIAENAKGKDTQVWVWNVTRLCGDVAPTGEVDMGDVIRLLNHVGYPGNSTYTLCNDWAGDCRCNGIINMGDVILLLNNVSYQVDPKYALACC